MGENVTLVCCGFSHSLVLVGENHLYSFGYNTDFFGDSQFTGKLGLLLLFVVIYLLLFLPFSLIFP